jgi:hypothetical protein
MTDLLLRAKTLEWRAGNVTETPDLCLSTTEHGYAMFNAGLGRFITQPMGREWTTWRRGEVHTPSPTGPALNTVKHGTKATGVKVETHREILVRRCLIRHCVLKLEVNMVIEDKWGEPVKAGDVVYDSNDDMFRVYAVGYDEGHPYLICRPIHQTTILSPKTVQKLFGEVTEDYGDYYLESDHV